jgi:transcriptional regulator with XRE-family HTH domain
MQAASRPNRIQELREARDLERYDLAAELRVSESMIRRYENGDSEIPLLKLRQLARFLETSVEQLMGWDGDQPEEAAA